MRILFWTDWFLPHIGGVEVFSARLLPALVRRGHTITVVAGHHAAGFPDEVDWEGVRVRRYAFHAALTAHDVPRIGDLLRAVATLKNEFRPEIVHLNTLGPSVFFHLETARNREARTLLTMHSPVMEDAGVSGTLYDRALQSADRINCNSSAVRNDLCSRVPRLCARSSVTYYGMDEPPLEPSIRPRDRPVVLAYGRVVPEKGFDVALRAYARVLADHPEVRFVVAGAGPAMGELEQLARDLGISAYVHFAGAVSPEQVPELLNQATVVVVPSRWSEPFGLVALEAAFMARPVVASRVGGLSEVVADGETGLLVPPEDPVALAGALTYLLQQYTVSDQMGLTARLRARQRFSWDRCVDEYERLYEILVSPEPSAQVTHEPHARPHVLRSEPPGRRGEGDRR